MSFRKFLAASTALCALVVGSAVAADAPMARQAPPPAYMPPAPIFSWTGFYAGLNAGGAFGNGNAVTYTSVAPSPFVGSFSTVAARRNGFTGGGQLGFNWQMNSLVWGLEADINYRQSNRGLNNTFTTLPAAFGNGTTVNVTGIRRANYFGTVRAVLGLAIERALVYVTGGLAYGSTVSGGTYTFNNPTAANLPVGLGVPAVVGPPAVAANYTYTTTSGGGTRAGWALGGGLKYALTPNWIVGVEYLHVDLGRRLVTYTNTGVATQFTTRYSNRDEIVRARLDYKW